MIQINEEALDYAAREEISKRWNTYGPKTLAQYASREIMDAQLLTARRIVEAYLSASAPPAPAEAKVDAVGENEWQRGLRDGFSEAIQIAKDQAALMADLAIEGLPENAREREAMEAALTRFSTTLSDTLDALLPSPSSNASEIERLRKIVERAQTIISTRTYPNWHASASAALSLHKEGEKK